MHAPFCRSLTKRGIRPNRILVIHPRMLLASGPSPSRVGTSRKGSACRHVAQPWYFQSVGSPHMPCAGRRCATPGLGCELGRVSIAASGTRAGCRRWRADRRAPAPPVPRSPTFPQRMASGFWPMWSSASRCSRSSFPGRRRGGGRSRRGRFARCASWAPWWMAMLPLWPRFRILHTASDHQMGYSKTHMENAMNIEKPVKVKASERRLTLKGGAASKAFAVTPDG